MNDNFEQRYIMENSRWKGKNTDNSVGYSKKLGKLGTLGTGGVLVGLGSLFLVSGVGAAIGVPIFITGAGLAAWGEYERHKRKKSNEMNQQQHVNSKATSQKQQSKLTPNSIQPNKEIEKISYSNNYLSLSERRKNKINEEKISFTNEYRGLQKIHKSNVRDKIL